jgi:hypothetical protein
MNNKIILYLDGQMSPEEKISFEKEISGSQILRDELKTVMEFKSGINGLKNIVSDDDYFVQMIPKFRNKLGQKKKFSFMPGIAYSATTATAVILIMLFVTNKSVKNQGPPVQNAIVNHQYTNAELQQETSSLSDQYGFVNMSREEVAVSDSLLNSMLIDELNLTPQSLSEISAVDNNTTDIKTILQGVNEQEADAIYKEILHKKIL